MQFHAHNLVVCKPQRAAHLLRPRAKRPQRLLACLIHRRRIFFRRHAKRHIAQHRILLAICHQLAQRRKIRAFHINIRRIRPALNSLALLIVFGINAAAARFHLKRAICLGARQHRVHALGNLVAHRLARSARFHHPQRNRHRVVGHAHARAFGKLRHVVMQFFRHRGRSQTQSRKQNPFLKHHQTLLIKIQKSRLGSLKSTKLQRNALYKAKPPKTIQCILKT